MTCACARDAVAQFYFNFTLSLVLAIIIKWQNDVLTIYDEVYDYFYDIIDVRRKNKFPFTNKYFAAVIPRTISFPFHDLASGFIVNTDNGYQSQMSQSHDNIAFYLVLSPPFK